MKFETVFNILTKISKIDSLDKFIYFVSHLPEFQNLRVRGGDVPFLEQIISQRGIEIESKKLNRPKNKALVLLINYLKNKNFDSKLLAWDF